MDIKEKIRKLLALGTSPNENEARAAMLKARDLMMRNKLTEQDFEEQDAKLVHLTAEEVYWTTDSGNIWMTSLANLIAQEHCCAVSWMTRGRTHTAIITGIGQDAYMCKDILTFAVGFVLGQMKVQKRRASVGSEKSAMISYARGFVMGLEIAYEAQKNEHPEWGLVAVQPQEVKEHISKLSSKSVKVKNASFDPLAYVRGQNDGMEFTKKKAIGQTS